MHYKIRKKKETRKSQVMPMPYDTLPSLWHRNTPLEVPTMSARQGKTKSPGIYPALIGLKTPEIKK